MCQYDQGRKHFLDHGNVIGGQSFTLEFLNGFMFEERNYKISWG